MTEWSGTPPHSPSISDISAISTSGLTKRFGRAIAVDNLDLDVREGDRYGFLGPNGSGKTTTVRMLLGLIYASSGKIEILGRRMPREVKRVLPDVGALVEGPAFYPHLSARANLSLFDAAGGGSSARSRRRRIGESLERVGLSGVGRKRVGAFSLGMRGRLGLASALLRAPRLLILDEPTNGLDPQGIAEVRALLTELNETDGTTIFLSSHLLGEVEALCTRVGVLNSGRLVVQDQMSALCGPTGRVLVTSPDADRISAVLGDVVVGRAADRVVVEGMAAADLAARLVPAGVRIAELVPERRTLEDIVLKHTGPGSDRVDPVRPDTVGDPLDEPVEESVRIVHLTPRSTSVAPTAPVEAAPATSPQTDPAPTEPSSDEAPPADPVEPKFLAPAPMEPEPRDMAAPPAPPPAETTDAPDDTDVPDRPAREAGA